MDRLSSGVYVPGRFGDKIRGWRKSAMGDDDAAATLLARIEELT